VYNVRAEGGSNMQSDARKHRPWSWWYLLFVVQFVALLWPPFYNKAEPDFIGIPFFYWYQLLWVLVAAVCNAIVYLVTDE
jgi:Protein of unknown function (DUF3311)